MTSSKKSLEEAFLDFETNPKDPVFVHERPDDEPPELAIRFEEYEEGGLSHYDFVEGITGVITEAQRALVTGEVPLEKILVREVGKKDGVQQYAPYLPWTFYVDALNKLTLWNWELVIEEWREDNVSVNCTGFLVIHGTERSIKIPCDGGAAKRRNSQTPADLRKTARADMVKSGATWFGIGLCLKDDRFKEEALALHGVQSRPEAKSRNELRELLVDHDEKICPKDEVKPRLVALGLQFEDWEFQSEKRYRAIIVAARQAMRRRG
jgi:hypothetical protein